MAGLVQGEVVDIGVPADALELDGLEPVLPELAPLPELEPLPELLTPPELVMLPGPTVPVPADPDPTPPIGSGLGRIFPGGGTAHEVGGVAMMPGCGIVADSRTLPAAPVAFSATPVPFATDAATEVSRTTQFELGAAASDVPPTKFAVTFVTDDAVSPTTRTIDGPVFWATTNSESSPNGCPELAALGVTVWPTSTLPRHSCTSTSVCCMQAGKTIGGIGSGTATGVFPGGGAGVELGVTVLPVTAVALGGFAAVPAGGVAGRPCETLLPLVEDARDGAPSIGCTPLISGLKRTRYALTVRPPTLWWSNGEISV